MRSFGLFALAPVMIVVLSALVASPAVALESVWLVGGSKPSREFEAVSAGDLKLEYTEFMGLKIKVKVECMVNERLVVGGAKAMANPKWDETLKVTEINGDLPILCNYDEAGPCETTSNGELEPANLPWLTEITLDEAQYLDLVLNSGNGNPGWIFLCLVLGTTVTEECTTTKAEPEIVSGTGGVTLTLYSKSFEPDLECVGTKKLTTSVEGEIETRGGPGNTLAVSEA